MNCPKQDELSIGETVIDRVDEFQYLGSVITKNGGTDEDIKQRLKKANVAFMQLKPIWKSQQLRRQTKLRIFETNVKSVLVYGCQTWKATIAANNKLQAFVNKCLRRIINIRWPEKISNEDLWKKCKQQPIAKTIKSRKYGWIGHTLRREQESISRQALDWNPQGKRKIGRPKTTWRRTVEREIKEEGKTWREIKNLAQNRVRWRTFVAALLPP